MSAGNFSGQNLRTLRHLSLHSIEELDVSDNGISSIAELDVLVPLRLESLSLLGNPVTQHPNYRALVISKLTNLKVLDNKIVSEKEKLAVKEGKEIASSILHHAFAVHRVVLALQRKHQFYELKEELMQVAYGTYSIFRSMAPAANERARLQALAATRSAFDDFGGNLPSLQAVMAVLQHDDDLEHTDNDSSSVASEEVKQPKKNLSSLYADLSSDDEEEDVDLMAAYDKKDSDILRQFIKSKKDTKPSSTSLQRYNVQASKTAPIVTTSTLLKLIKTSLRSDLGEMHTLPTDSDMVVPVSMDSSIPEQKFKVASLKDLHRQRADFFYAFQDEASRRFEPYASVPIRWNTSALVEAGEMVVYPLSHPFLCILYVMLLEQQTLAKQLEQSIAQLLTERMYQTIRPQNTPRTYDALALHEHGYPECRYLKAKAVESQREMQRQAQRVSSKLLTVPRKSCAEEEKVNVITEENKRLKQAIFAKQTEQNNAVESLNLALLAMEEELSKIRDQKNAQDRQLATLRFDHAKQLDNTHATWKARLREAEDAHNAEVMQMQEDKLKLVRALEQAKEEHDYVHSHAVDQWNEERAQMQSDMQALREQTATLMDSLGTQVQAQNDEEAKRAEGPVIEGSLSIQMHAQLTRKEAQWRLERDKVSHLEALVEKLTKRITELQAEQVQAAQTTGHEMATNTVIQIAQQEDLDEQQRTIDFQARKLKMVHTRLEEQKGLVKSLHTRIGEEEAARIRVMQELTLKLDQVVSEKANLEAQLATAHIDLSSVTQELDFIKRRNVHPRVAPAVALPATPATASYVVPAATEQKYGSKEDITKSTPLASLLREKEPQSAVSLLKSPAATTISAESSKNASPFSQALRSYEMNTQSSFDAVVERKDTSFVSQYNAIDLSVEDESKLQTDAMMRKLEHVKRLINDASHLYEDTDAPLNTENKQQEDDPTSVVTPSGKLSVTIQSIKQAAEAELAAEREKFDAKEEAELLYRTSVADFQSKHSVPKDPEIHQLVKKIEMLKASPERKRKQGIIRRARMSQSMIVRDPSDVSSDDVPLKKKVKKRVKKRGMKPAKKLNRTVMASSVRSRVRKH